MKLTSLSCALVAVLVVSCATVPLQAQALPDTPSASAQQQTAAPANETEAQRKERIRAAAEAQVKAEEKQRIGGIVPNFNVVISGPGVPLSPRQKLELSYHTIIDPYTIGLAVLGGAIGEITDDHTGYHHGPAGYFKRFGASYLDNVDGNLVGNALLPILLHQDPRYYRKGTGSLGSRIVYSALTTFIAKNDKGRKQFNTSNVLGNFISGAISNAYYPADERGVSLTISNATYVTLEGMLGAQLLEFSPDVSQMIHRRREAKRQAKREAAAAAQAAQISPTVTPTTQPSTP